MNNTSEEQPYTGT